MVHTITEANSLIEVKFEIYESDGYLCASGVGTSIHTWAKTWNKLMKNMKMPSSYTTTCPRRLSSSFF